jgi:hypothetical protein
VSRFPVVPILLALLGVTPLVVAQTELEATAGNGYTVAILPFAADEDAFGELGADLQTLMTAHLSGNPAVILVERGDLDQALSEVELSISGTVDPKSAAEIGYITGAQILITGRAFAVQKELVVAAKVIGVETTRVLGATSSMPLRGSVVELSTTLSDKVNAVLSERGATLIAHKEKKEDVVARLLPKLAGRELPSVMVSIPEISLTQEVPDPAAQTEIEYVLQRLGFRIIDPEASNESADLEINGEAFSEFGLRKGNLVSTKARVEIKVIDRVSSTVLLVDRQTSVAVDLSPEIAGKNALAKAGGVLAERVVEALIKRP